MPYFIGIIVSLLVQWLKSSMKTSQTGTLIVLAVVAILGASGYTLLVNAGWWDSISSILLTAGSFYAFFLQRFETSNTTVTVAPVDQG